MGITDLAQTPDGFLWIASLEGLIRFDGVKFEKITLPRQQENRGSVPVSLYVSRKGELWVGFGQRGGVAVQRGGSLVDMRMPEPPPMIIHIAEDVHGDILAVWGGDQDRLRRFAGGGWKNVEHETKLPAGQIISSRVASDSSLWLGLIDHLTNTSVLAVLRPGSAHFESVPVRGLRPSVTEDDAHKLWISDSVGTRQIRPAGGGHYVDNSPGYAQVDGVKMPEFVFDRAGGIWGLTRTVGIFHIPAATSDPALANHVDSFKGTDGLLSDFTVAILRGREGSIWFGGPDGLERFRMGSVVLDATVPPDPAEGMVMGSANNGSVFVASKRRLFEIKPGADPQERLVLDDESLALCSSGRNAMWLVEAGKILRIDGPSQTSMPLPE